MSLRLRSIRTLYGSVIFLGAFLLFAIEPMAAKRLLPTLGGSSTVWIACLAFFQVMLLLGYLYAHRLGRIRSTPLSARLHLALLTLATAVLLLFHQPVFNNDAAANPLTTIFTTLTLTIGLPFLLLASAGPLLQLWLAREQNNLVPWRLFALSNAGSLLALALYPTVIERYLSLHQQQTIWTIGFILYALLCALLARHVTTLKSAPEPASQSKPESRSNPQTRLLWFLLAAGASMQLCAVTSHLSQNIAAIPLLWVLPLAVYLLTFILAFEVPNLYRRAIVVRLLVVFLASLGYILSKTDISLPILIGIAFFLIELFVACLFCHAEAYHLRPQSPSEATLFYLLLAAGGATGTIFIGIACPLLFSANYDLSLAFFATAALALAVTWHNGWPQRLLWSTATILLFALLIMLRTVYARNALVEVRNFYGSLRVKQSFYPPQSGTARTLLHGNIEHGTQWFAPEFRRTPTTYYAPDSGVGLALRLCCEGHPRNIGAVGLGTGTIAAYGQPGDRIRFYEINPAVRPIAEHLFTYLRDSPATISFSDGDARISLAREAQQNQVAQQNQAPQQNFDVLIIDAFSGDAIPVHLLTTQAMQVYRRQLAPTGILAFHVSNQYLDLAPEIAELAASSGMASRLVDTPSNDASGEYRATWVLVTNNNAFLSKPELAHAAEVIHRQPHLTAWTDDRSSLLPLLQWRSSSKP